MNFRKTVSIVAGSMLAFTVSAQNNPQAAGQPALHFKKLNQQLQYAFIVDKPTSPHPQEGDQVSLNMQAACNNRLMFSTYQQFKGKPGVYGVAKPAFKGDLIEAITQMTPGDSIVCLVNADSLFKNSKTRMPAFIKPGDKMQYYIKLVSIKPKAQVQKEQQAAFMKQIKEQQEKQKAAAAKQLLKDDKELKAYFTSHNITPQKTASGLYYTINEEGHDEKPQTGDSITMNYTGTLLNGTKFDSNVDTAFHHVQPFQFVLGRGSVIKGWDEGVAILKTGSKATLYIPSPLAYGQQSMPGSSANPKGIPANSILLFDVELVGYKHPETKTISLKTTNTDSVSAPIKQTPVKEEK